MKLEPLDVISTSFTVPPDDTCLHIVVTVPADKKRRREEDTDTSVAKRAKIVEDHEHLISAIKTKYPAPSMGAKVSEFRKLQANSETRIKNGRPLDYTSPPISIYHPVFAEFPDHAADPSTIPSADILKATHEIFQFSSEFYTDEPQRQNKISELFCELLGMSVHPMSPGDGSCNDGAVVAFCPVFNTNALCAIVQYKLEMGLGGTDAAVQGTLGFAKWQQLQGWASVCCCPTFIIAIVGPYVCILGAVIADDVLVEPLTDFLWLGGTPHLNEHVVTAARVFDTLKTCLEQLQTFYQGLRLPTDNARLFVYPYFNSYRKDDRDVHLTYVDRIGFKDERASRALFEAKTDTDNRVVVKFVKDYSARGHKLLAQHGLAPALHCFKSIGGGMHVVVMDLVQVKTLFELVWDDIPQTIRQTILDDIKKAVCLLHDAGLVFGDLRPPNVMVVDQPETGHKGVMLIDFDWCGDEGEARYPAVLNDTQITWHEGVVHGGLILKEHDMHQLAMLEPRST
ncbi:hypothetical protein BKA93DRAFT_798376 [Sparassis latifolia]